MIRRALILVLASLCAGCAPALQAQVRAVDNLKVQTAVTAYEAARGGPALDRWVKAKLVAIAYQDAEDPTNASAWRAREREDCQAAIAATGVAAPAQPATRPGT